MKDVRDYHSPSACKKHLICVALCADACWHLANQSVCTREISFVCIVTEKGVHPDHPCNHHPPDLLSVTIQEKRKNHYSFVGARLLSIVFRHERSTQKERVNSHKEVAEPSFCVAEKNKRGFVVPRGWGEWLCGRS